ncbi:MAG TPA: T9SS type A sorting domain-containing protein [Brumimicrobium sp.]|nr:T9SS type A sorting domain-containing protein [Brumimicrobium sp.]
MKKKLLNLSLLFLTVIVFGPKLNAQCLEPTAFTSTTITANTADITWTAGGSEGDWNISWGTPGYTPGDIDEIGNDVSTTNSFGITNLSPNIQYDAYVQADCGGGDESAWEGPLNFTTLCTPSTGVDTQTACGSFTWTGGDGAVYTASNNTATYTFTGGAANGCDSIVTLDLTMTTTVAGTDVQSACDSYLWINGVTYTADENTATHTIVGGSVHGCDSIVTLNLTINNSATGIDTQTACGSFTWTGGDGAVYTASNNTATYTFTGGAANGCDSIVTLDLTINIAVTGTDTQSACGSFTWTGGDGAVYTSSNNTATYTFTGGAANGCDSIVTLDLTINSSVTGTDTQSACGSYTWIDGVEYTANENSATYTLVGGAANGCDSIVTLNLTMHPAISAGNDNAITVCLNEPVNLAPLLSSGADAGGTWIAPNGSTLTNTNVIASSVGSTYSYKYVVSSPNCDDVIAVITFTVDKECDYLAVSENILETISVYPNPATTQLNIINPSNESSLKVEVLDMNGRVVLLEKKALNNASEATIAIDHLEKGIYTLRVYNEEGQRTFKIVKQ